MYLMHHPDALSSMACVRFTSCPCRRASRDRPILGWLNHWMPAYAGMTVMAPGLADNFVIYLAATAQGKNTFRILMWNMLHENFNLHLPGSIVCETATGHPNLLPPCTGEKVSHDRQTGNLAGNPNALSGSLKSAVRRI